MSSHAVLEAAWEAFEHQNFVQSAHLAGTALQVDPGNTFAAMCLVMSEHWLGADSSQTLRALKKLVKNAPQVTLLHLYIGSVYAHKGDLEKAQAAYETAVRLDPDNPHNFLELTTVKKFTTFDSACARMQSVYDAGVDNDVDLSAVCFGLSKVYDDLGDYESAIKYTLEAKKAQSFGFAPLRADQHLSAVRQLARNGAFAAVPDSGNASDAPVFIVGMPRSGTSLAETILGRHKLVRPCGEMIDAPNIAGRLALKFPQLRSAQVPAVQMFSHVGQSELAEEAQQWLDKVAGMKGDRYTRFTDKLPGNTVHLGLLAKLFPKARVIYVQRNPLDCCVSNLFARFGRGLAFTNRQDWLGGYFRYTENIVSAWREAIDIPVLDVCYEELVSEPEAQTRRMVEFAGLDWDEACLDHTKGRNEVRTVSMWQARQPISRKSVDRWRRYEPWIQELIEALGGYEALGVDKGQF